MRKPRAVDLISGCGGLTEGLKNAGFRVIGAVEISVLAAETYAMNHPAVKLWNEDIKIITAKSVLKRLRLKPGRLELLAGCPPCQGFSRMRNLNGRYRVHEKANDLIFEFLRFVRVLRP